MCRGTGKRCSLLTEDPTDWSREAPLPVPGWFDAALDQFAAAIKMLANGNRDQAAEQLLLVPDQRLSDYFIDHGQQTFHHRNRVLGIPDPQVRFVEGRRPKSDRAAKQFESTVLPLDGYRCRYCGIRVVPFEVFHETERVLGRDRFRMSDPEGRKASNAQRHGAALAFCAVVDHILPWNFGGDSCLTNLVTSCFSCNYGKGRYTLEQLGLDDPLSRPALVDPWQGLTEHLGPLRALEIVE